MNSYWDRLLNAPNRARSYIDKKISQYNDSTQNRYGADERRNLASERSALEEYNNAIGAQQGALTGAQQENAPWIAAGQQAMSKYNNLDYTPERFDYSQTDFYRDPSYNFRLNEGVKALDRSAAARGKVLSGQQEKALANYGQNLASQEYNAAYNRAMQANRLNNAYNRQYYGDKLSQYGNLLGYGYRAGQSNVNALAGYGANVANIYGQRARTRYNTPQLNKADNRYWQNRDYGIVQDEMGKAAQLAGFGTGVLGNALRVFS